MSNWHVMEIKEILSSLGSSLEGLTQQEAKTRLEKYGPNEFMEKEKISALKIFIDQFKSFLIIILLEATVVSAFVGEWLDAIVIACAFLGLYQEYKAEKAVETLKKIAALTARVFREGEKVEIPARDIVSGDIVALRTGDKVPADCRLIEEMNLRVRARLKLREVLQGVWPSGYACWFSQAPPLKQPYSWGRLRYRLPNGPVGDGSGPPMDAPGWRPVVKYAASYVGANEYGVCAVCKPGQDTAQG
jgi:hypothetical protein